MKYTKCEIMTANKFKLELISIKQAITKAQEERDYNNWVEQTSLIIKDINRRIRESYK